MHVRGNINDIFAMMLFNAGATVPLVSREKFEKISISAKLNLMKRINISNMQLSWAKIVRKKVV